MALSVYLCSVYVFVVCTVCTSMCVTRCAPADVRAQVSVCVRLDMQEQNQLQCQSLPSTHFPEGEVLPRRPGAAPTQLQQPQLELASLSLSTPQRVEGADHT